MTALPATRTLIVVVTDPATATLRSVCALPATATLRVVSVHPATATLCDVFAVPATATLSTPASILAVSASPTRRPRITRPITSAIGAESERAGRRGGSAALTAEQAISDTERVTTVSERSPRTAAERSGVRDALLAAAERLILEKGARGLTTREIAREAGCSDSALYVHFEDKAHLMASLCERWTPDLRTFLGSLIERVGAGTVEENLRDIAVVSLRVYRDMVPTTFAIAGDPEMLVYHRAALRAAGRGPRASIEAVAAYISAEQRLGRVRSDADPVMAANLLMGSCWQRAALAHYFGEDLIEMDDATYARELAAMIMRGLHQEVEA